MSTTNGTWHPDNGWGVQIWAKKGKHWHWRHITTRAQWYTKAMAQAFVDGLLEADYDCHFRMVDRDGATMREWNRPPS